MQRNAELVSCCVANCPSPPEPFGQRCGTSERPILDGGTDGSNPVPSSGESVSLPELLSRVENPGFPRGCALLAWRPGRQRRAGCYKIAPIGGNISVAPYSSTAVPADGVGENAMPVPIMSGGGRSLGRAVE